jgi:hypothetical protein
LVLFCEQLTFDLSNGHALPRLQTWVPSPSVPSFPVFWPPTLHRMLPSKDVNRWVISLNVLSSTTVLGYFLQFGFCVGPERWGKISQNHNSYKIFILNTITYTGSTSWVECCCWNWNCIIQNSECNIQSVELCLSQLH